MDFTDPNAYPFFHGEWDGSVPGGLQAINCEAAWIKSESPEGRTWPCTAVSQGYFGLQILPGTNGPADVKDFKVRLIHSVEPGSGYSNIPIRVVAEAGPFTEGITLKGSCMKSGWCGFSASMYSCQKCRVDKIR